MKICLNMIVRNESKVIERLLDSVQSQIDCWYITDTGSTDNTPELISEKLRGIPGYLDKHEWKNFGYNRTQSLKSAQKYFSDIDWILLLDADMVLEGTIDRAELDSGVDGYSFLQNQAGLEYWNIRLVNAKRNWKSVGPTHEYWSCENGTQHFRNLFSVRINDISDGGSKSDKFERDIKLLLEALKEEPENPRYMFYLGQSYRDIQNYEESSIWYGKCSNLTKWDEEKWYAEYMIGWNLLCSQKLEYEDQLWKAWKMRPWRIEPLFVLGTEYKKSGNWYLAYSVFKICATTEFPLFTDVLFIQSDLYKGISIDEFGVAAFYCKKFDEAKACFERLFEEPEYIRSEETRNRLLKNIELCDKYLKTKEPLV